MAPHLPCCFSTNQYGERSAILYQTLMREEHDTNVKIRKRGGLGYIVKYDKQIYQESSGEHRYGLLPPYIHMAFVDAGVETSVINPSTKEEMFPVIRMGLPESSASIIHALEYATSEMYRNMDYEQRVEFVDKVRHKLAKRRK